MLDRYVYFNPLDRGNLYLMYVMQRIIVGLFMKMFQSPRSRKFVSDSVSRVWTKEKSTKTFQSPRSGKFISDRRNLPEGYMYLVAEFQSPRSGKFVSDPKCKWYWHRRHLQRFNPLNRGNLYLIC